MHSSSSVSRTARISSTLNPARRLLASVSVGVALPISAEQRFQLALEAQTSGNYAEMLTELRAAADGGLVEANELLAMVLLVGPTLYGDAVRVELCESARRMRAAAVDGGRVGSWQMHFINRLRHAPGAARDCS